MSRCDGTGPGAMGKMNGRGAGNCFGGQRSGKVKSGAELSAAGRGICGWFHASDLAGRSSKENEGKLLAEQADALKKQLDELNKRLSERGK